DIARAGCLHHLRGALLGSGRGRVEIEEETVRTGMLRCFFRSRERAGSGHRRNQQLGLGAKRGHAVDAVNAVRVCRSARARTSGCVGELEIPCINGVDATLGEQATAEDVADLAAPDYS